MHGLVIGANREISTAVVQTLVTHGCRVAFHHLLHLPATLDHLRRTAYNALIYVCPHARCSRDCLLRHLRAAGNQRPVLVIAARGPHWAGCLNAGADWYMAGPHDEEFFVAQYRAMVRRCRRAAATGEILRVGDPAQGVTSLTLDRKHRTATREGKPIALSQRETDLLEYLMTHPGEICSQEDICEKAWGCAFKPGTNAVHTNINRLREKIDDGFPTCMIENVRGKGFRLKAEFVIPSSSSRA
jgi:two-component system, OmpR family, response regulator